MNYGILSDKGKQKVSCKCTYASGIRDGTFCLFYSETKVLDCIGEPCEKPDNSMLLFKEKPL